jgi:peptide/nickel transport system substrate-binding protein
MQPDVYSIMRQLIGAEITEWDWLQSIVAFKYIRVPVAPQINFTEGEIMKSKKERYAGLTRRDFLYLSGMGMAGITLVGIPGRSEAQEKKPKYGGILRIGERYGSTGLDAHRNQSYMDFQDYVLMYNALTEMGELPQVRIYPSLAKSWEISRDGREYTFPLREGVKFHHGKELDSGDVKYSIERVMNPATKSPRAFAFKWIDSVNIIDKYHLKIKLKEPFAPFPASLTIMTCPIIPAGVEPTPTKPAPGTGPFLLKSFVPNENVELSRFNQYWEVDEATGNRLPYVDSIHLIKILDESVRWTALQTGDIDFVDTPPLNVVAKAILEKPVPNIFVDYDCPGNAWIWFNTTKPPFDNKKVRQAVAYALDKKKILEAVYWGLGYTLNNQPFVAESRFHIPVKDREVNLAKAKQLLAEAGYPNGFKTEFFEYYTPYDVAGCQAAMGQLKQIGIDATMKVIEMAPWIAAMRKGDYSIAYRGDSERFDWDDAFYMYFHSSEIGQNNYPRYVNKDLDALLEKGRTTIKMEDRRPIYRRVVEIIQEDLPVHYINKSVIGVAFRDYLKGFRKGFAMRYAWSGGGTKYWWLDK